MAVDERARHQLYLEAEQKLGPEAAATLMELLPPAGWADVATKQDLDLKLNALGSNLREEMRTMEAGIERSLRSLTMWLVATMLTVATIAVAVARFA